MTAAELSREHAQLTGRLVAVETSQAHFGEKVTDTQSAVKELSRKIDKVAWGVIGILGATVVQLLLALLKK